MGKQRVEAKQLIDILEGRQSRWSNHPACKMWVGYTDALKCYCNCMINEWVRRGYKNTMTIYSLPGFYHTDILGQICRDDFRMIFTWPPWFGDDRIHSSHRAALLAKDFMFYSKFNWLETPQIKYYWPVK